MVEKKTNINRAKQFMPFSPLKGYYNLILEKQRTKEEKKELCEDRIEELCEIINVLKIGDLVKVKYYDKDCYVTKERIITRYDKIYNIIYILKTEIPICDIYDIKLINKNTD